MVDAIDEKRKQRFAFLKLVYEKSGGSERNWVNLWDVGKELGWDRETTDLTTQYLVGEGLIKFWALGGNLGITHWGVKQIEDALQRPEEETEYFPAVVNIISVGSMIDSTIEAGGDATSQRKVIKIGDNATITAPITIADSIANSFNALAKSGGGDDVNALLDALLRAVTDASKVIGEEDTEAAEEMARDAETLVKEAASTKPRRTWYEMSIAGLEQSAASIGAVGAPILGIVGELRQALLGG